MQEASNSKQQIAEKIKQSANILVTVSSNPSVDALTAALGLTLMLNKLDKHATAVFSGVIPPAINFLEPGKTFENNVDSLRDFIIALDKDKADRLRYKVEDDVVRIFITPYRTKISQSDLQFSQGDFNVDLIIALGVEDQKDLDQAITAHGRILHDATVATINAGSLKSNLGSIDWQDAHASSLSEMLASMADSLKAGILDQQISTALLTGIVASTERFSNQKTTPHVMTISAQLMAAGANQQLIATKLQTIPAPVSPRRENPKAQAAPEASKKVSADNQDDGEMHINHGNESKEQPAPLPMEPVAAPEPIEPAPAPEPEPELPIAPPAAQNFDDLKQAIQQETVQAAPQREMVSEPPTPGSQNINDAENDDEKPESDEESYLTTHPSWQGRELKPPTMGGTLNATSEQALEDKIRSESDEKRNQKILTHGGGAPAEQTQQQSSPSKKRKRKKGQGQGGGQQAQQPQAAAQPVPAPVQPAPAPVATPAAQPAPQAAAPTPEPAPAPEAPTLTPEPIAPAPEMPLPAPTPAPEPEQRLPEIPVAPPPMVVAEPLTPPADSLPPAPAPEPAQAAPTPQAAHEPTLEELEREAANHAAQAVAPQTLSELEAEAHAHADKVAAPQAGPSPAPSELGAMPMPQPFETPAPAAPAPALAPQPEMPPTGLPPLPPMPDFSTLPPVPAAPELPQLPQQPLQQPAVPQPPQTAPQPPQAPQQTPPPAAPADPSQFRIPGQ